VLEIGVYVLMFQAFHNIFLIEKKIYVDKIFLKSMKICLTCI
jgi:hypothetical protein